MAEIQFVPDPPDVKQLQLIAKLTGGQRIRLMLEARELAVGLIRCRLRRRYPDLSINALNLKVLEEIQDAERRKTRSYNRAVKPPG